MARHSHSSPARCAALLQDVLYLVVALLPVIALLVFDECKSLCVGEAPLGSAASSAWRRARIV